MIIFCCAPWKTASDSDEAFKKIMNGNLLDVLRAWDKLNYVTIEIMDLFDKFFQFEGKRINLKEIKRHPWIR